MMQQRFSRNILDGGTSIAERHFNEPFPITDLITGAAGNLGSLLAWHLLDPSDVAFRLMTGRWDLPPDLDALERVEVVRVDPGVHQVEELFALADGIEARNAKARAGRGPHPALLPETYRGELVPQDPNDEPAAVLLEHIKDSQ